MKIAVSAAVFLIALVSLAVDTFSGVNSEKVDVPNPTTQVGQVSASALNQSKFTYARVVKVVDGDTVTVQPDTALNSNGEKFTLRLIGINTPETVDPRKKVECFGKEASAEAKRLLLGKIVRLEYDDSQDTKDKYGRLLAYLYVVDDSSDSTENDQIGSVAELFFNKYMIERGYAYEYTYEKVYRYQKDFKAAQQVAESSQIGLWSPDACNTGQKRV